MKKGVFILLLIICFTFAGCGDENNVDPGQTGQSDDSEKVYNFDYAIHVALNTNYGELCLGFADKVREASAGRLNITIRPTGELPYTPQEYLRVCGDGTVGMVDGHSSYISGDCKLATLPSLPFLTRDMDEFALAVDTLRQELDTEFASFNTTILFYWPDSPQRIWGTGELPVTWDDFKNMKIRTASAEQQHIMSNLGAIPVSMAVMEVPAATSRGVVTGLLTGAVAVDNYKFSEFLDWGYPVVVNNSGVYCLINNDLLNSLPEDLRGILLEQAALAQEEFKNSQDEYEAIAINTLRNAGMEIPEVDAENIIASSDYANDIMIPYWIEWAETNELTAELEKIRGVLEEARIR